MSCFPRPDARVRAVLASLAAVVALVTLLVWRPTGLLSVALALLCVLLGMIAGVAVTAARQAGGDTPAQAWPALDEFEMDADTLEAFDPQGLRDPEATAHDVDADTLDALDPRKVRESRRVNGLSDR